jgi:hypothetical protein
MSAKELRKQVDLACFQDELNATANVFDKAVAMKAMIMKQDTFELATLFRVLFIWTCRDQIFNIQSCLKALERQYGHINTLILLQDQWVS